MSDALARLFNDFDRGRISRRRLLQALGVAAVLRPAVALGQSRCGPNNSAADGCDKTVAKAPFAPTGWKTTILDHFSMQVVDYQKEAAYFAALMNWKIRSDDGAKAVLDIGDWGGIEISGGLPAPPPPPPPDPAAAGAGGRGGGRGGGGRRSVITGFCWGIEPWDTKKVEAELQKRGLNPVADHQGKDFQSFHVKDPGGFDVQISNGSRKNRRTTPANGKTGAPAPFEPTNWKTLYLDHISFQAPDYKAAYAFYVALLGWTPGEDTGSQNECQIGDVGGIIIRGGAGPARGNTAGRGGAAGNAADAGRAGAPPAPATPPAPRPASIDHIAFGISPWDADAVKAELDKRGLSGSVDTGGTGDIHTAKYQSYHTNTPNGYNLQISNTISK